MIWVVKKNISNIYLICFTRIRIPLITVFVSQINRPRPSAHCTVTFTWRSTANWTSASITKASSQCSRMWQVSVRGIGAGVACTVMSLATGAIRTMRRPKRQWAASIWKRVAHKRWALHRGTFVRAWIQCCWRCEDRARMMTRIRWWLYEVARTHWFGKCIILMFVNISNILCFFFFVFNRHLLSADTKDEREKWCAYFNKALVLVRSWGAGSSVWYF